MTPLCDLQLALLPIAAPFVGLRLILLPWLATLVDIHVALLTWAAPLVALQLAQLPWTHCQPFWSWPSLERDLPVKLVCILYRNKVAIPRALFRWCLLCHFYPWIDFTFLILPGLGPTHWLFAIPSVFFPHHIIWTVYPCSSISIFIQEETLPSTASYKQVWFHTWSEYPLYCRTSVSLRPLGPLSTVG